MGSQLRREKVVELSHRIQHRGASQSGAPLPSVALQVARQERVLEVLCLGDSEEPGFGLCQPLLLHPVPLWEVPGLVSIEVKRKKAFRVVSCLQLPLLGRSEARVPLLVQSL